MARNKLIKPKLATILLILYLSLPVHSKNGCTSDDDCSQLCQRKSCTCISDFELDADNRSCYPVDPNWKLLSVSSDQIFFVSNIEDDLEEVEIDLEIESVISVTFDARNNIIYSTAYLRNPGNHTSATVPSNLAVLRTEITYAGTSTVILRYEGLEAPNSMSLDWTTGNLYFIESFRNRISACSSTSFKCSLIISKSGLSSGHSICLNPQVGFMFWVEATLHNSSILRADMDGTSSSVVVEVANSLISSLAVDIANRRIYWSVTDQSVISSSKLNGQGHRVISNRYMRSVQRINIFGDNMFWTQGNATNHIIQSANKMTGMDVKSHGEVLSDTGKFVAVYHIAAQPIFGANPCHRNTCSHMCVLSVKSPGHFKCLPPMCQDIPVRTGVISCHRSDNCLLDDNLRFRISSESDYLVVAYDNILAFTLAGNLKNLHNSIRFEREQISEVNTITSLDYNPLRNTIILTDSQKVYEYDPTSKALDELVEPVPHKVLSLGIDEVGENLYWISDNGTVTVMSLRSRYQLVLVSDLENPCEILMLPNHGSFLVASQATPETILIKSFHLNGSPMTPEHTIQSSGCITWAYDQNNGYIFWSQPGYPGDIRIIQFLPDGRMRNYDVPVYPTDQQNLIRHPNSIVTFEGQTFWVDSVQLNLNRIGRIGSKYSSRPFLTKCESDQVKLKSRQFQSRLTLMTTSKLISTSPCDSLRCSHLCLVSHPITELRGVRQDNIKCSCGTGFVLNADKRTCINIDRSVESPEIDTTEASTPLRDLTTPVTRITTHTSDTVTFSSDPSVGNNMRDVSTSSSEVTTSFSDRTTSLPVITTYSSDVTSSTTDTIASTTDVITFRTEGNDEEKRTTSDSATTEEEKVTIATTRMDKSDATSELSFSLDVNCKNEHYETTKNTLGTENPVSPFAPKIFQLHLSPSINGGPRMTKLSTGSFATVLLFVICLASVLLVYFIRRRKPQRSTLSSEEIQEFFDGKTNSVECYEKLAYHKPTWEISRGYFEIDCEKSLGSDEFGDIRKGFVKRNVFLDYIFSETQSEMQMKEMKMGVAVKIGKHVSLRSMQGLLAEIKMMTYLGQHENIVSLIGAYTHELDKGLVYAFMELCERGSLLRYLKRVQSEDGALLEKWSLEILSGMEFLAEKNITHGRLCAANVWLTCSKTAKITGFGRILKGRTIEQIDPQVWRWMAPETLQKQVFNQKSDVWAFGVTLWEIYSGGTTPYPDISKRQRYFVGKLKSGRARLEKTDNCDFEIHSIMLKCWSIKASARPTFAQLKEEFIDLLNSFV